MDFQADMKCRVCTYIDIERDLQNMTRDEALGATLDCPNCDESDGLEVIDVYRQHIWDT